MRSAWTRSPNQPHQELNQFPMPPNRAVPKQHLSFLSLSPITAHVAWSEDLKPLSFTSPTDMLNYVTLNWRDNFVTVDLSTRDLVEKFTRRPFFMLINVDAPVLVRYSRSREYVADLFPWRIPSHSKPLDTNIDHWKSSYKRMTKSFSGTPRTAGRSICEAFTIWSISTSTMIFASFRNFMPMLMVSTSWTLNIFDQVGTLTSWY